MNEARPTARQVVDKRGDRWLVPRRAGLEIGDVAAPATREVRGLVSEGYDRLASEIIQ
jgi:hypothetical protein